MFQPSEVWASESQTVLLVKGKGTTYVPFVSFEALASASRNIDWSTIERHIASAILELAAHKEAKARQV